LSDLVTIGRFAQIARLTPRALRLYDESGLLSPAVTDAETGYRRYRLDQLRDAERIRELRELEVPLEDIREALGGAAAHRAVLERHRARLESRLETTRARLERLATLLEEAPMAYDVNLKTVPDRPVLFVRERVTLPETGGVLRRAMAEACALLERRGARGAGAPYCAYPLPEEGEVVPVDSVVPTEAMLQGEGRVRSRLEPGGEVAFTVHVGPYEDLPAAFAAVAAWVGANGLEVSGALREIYHDHDPGPARRHRVEVQFPVRRA
jgi:DNA-binding transcriptional MerR regulator